MSTSNQGPIYSILLFVSSIIMEGVGRGRVDEVVDEVDEVDEVEE